MATTKKSSSTPPPKPPTKTDLKVPITKAIQSRIDFYKGKYTDAKRKTKEAQSINRNNLESYKQTNVQAKRQTGAAIAELSKKKAPSSNSLGLLAGPKKPSKKKGS